MSEVSQGEWKVGESHFAFPIECNGIVIGAAYRRLIDSDCRYTPHPPIQEARANARLMVAAPKLLSALEALLLDPSSIEKKNAAAQAVQEAKTGRPHEPPQIV